ncbi:MULTISPECIES: MarR family winged helix-turn-helix transcriptional regulator [Elizabethkingia]|uniref:MarR family transcriptional regulator n=1 Tax=Elizabethkingia anophelis TaxID=1117645 RepID=A0A494J8T0_9FLAO|nr:MULTISPECIES: helix-turn-helix domain-containing protein [Elizabethkingia]AQX51360.1 MarR family transcriptional regulator [Elizabethkingia anophelis]MCT4196654.1 winged helix-turn-helix transcriptional regulator [Elizabethkingia anophelis]MCT4225402.1 winged helix-turn-helix transcriptional regulator [Elizabethkingia anophelis]MCT4306993.1 winged helix-turn-helix transcriptional regulator [Elizabethkingia anophelis]MDV2472754.1 MarR family transcriptional regulator [Elizabethkingia anophel
MDYTLLKDTIKLVEQFEAELQKSNQYDHNIESFKRWVADQITEEQSFTEPYWEGKENKRTPESAISTLIVHMNRYAKTYSKSAMYGSAFSTQEEFIYLINLRAFGGMTKMELIKKNIQEKPAGIQIINRLLQQGWIEQSDSSKDKRSKIIQITTQGLHALDAQMNKIRQATQIVAGNLTRKEKMKLIELLNKLNEFHHPIFTQNIETSELLDSVIENNFKVL